jgi:hypothetical protein
MVDATIYYANNYPTAGVSSTESNRRYYLGLRGIIKAVSFDFFCTVANGTNENIPCSVRLNNTTDYPIQTVGASAAHRQFSNYNLNIPLIDTDFFSIKIDSPTWATNPDGVYVIGFVLIEVS